MDENNNFKYKFIIPPSLLLLSEDLPPGMRTSIISIYNSNC